MTDDLPHDATAERAALGCAILNPEYAGDVRPGWFYDQRLGHLAHALNAMSAEGRPISETTLYQRVSKDFHAALPLILECTAQDPTPAEFDHWRGILEDKARRRKTIKAAQGFLAHAFGANGEFETLVSDLEREIQLDIEGKFPTCDGKQAVTLLETHLQRRIESKGAFSGIATGLTKFDAMTDGLQFGEQTLIAARPSLGKTAIAMCIVAHACLINKISTLIISLEMSREALLRRLLSCTEEIPMKRLKEGDLNASDAFALGRFRSRVEKSPLFIVEGVQGMDSDQYAATVRRYTRQHGAKLVVTDYLQKVKCRTKHEKKTYEIGEVSGVIRGLAVSTKAAFLTLAQLNRESEKDKGRLPRVSDLADSGQIDRDADTIALLHRGRGKNDEPTAQLIIGKQRDGEVGQVWLDWAPEFCRFTDYKRKVEE
jgi:replicative DNA helicase